ncbi:MAG: choice-of-anchor Q domain-containing protein, partial [Candidatus Marinimicrobia bacterium]|nr:choice-of-anchor Q domain-containing protein [Candidatus Neomarinimicrobiota bacterium]
DNEIDGIDLNYAHTPGLFISLSTDNNNQDVVMGNNILFNNKIQSQTNNVGKDLNVGSNNGVQDIETSHNMIEDGPTTEDKVVGKPNFKNPTTGNYQLSSTSQAVDAGVYELPNGVDAPMDDIRGYYRVGEPDLGAYEGGASKYLLAMIDDIVEDKDITFVELAQEVKFTITTGDIEGKTVTNSNEPVKWDIFPNQKYARLETDADTSTIGGSASATVKVTSEEKGKGFRFRVIADVGGASLRSEMYVIEELVTGAPPPVANLTISPSDWTSDPNFTLNWETPTWVAQRGLIGAVVEITDGINVYNEYMGFPSGDTLTNYSFTAPEAGQYDAHLWLIDELGNEDQDSAMSVTAYFDNVTPEEFNIHWPSKNEWVNDTPQFRWEMTGDYPSGIEIYHLFLNEQHYAKFDLSQVNYDNSSEEIYVDATISIPDGYHSWHLEAWDMAGNITWSNDTINFGVDITPPNISHPSPLGTIDEGSTTPTINVSFSDGASGVRFGRLHYRRSGSGSGFVTLDLLGGPVSIPGS